MEKLIAKQTFSNEFEQALLEASNKAINALMWSLALSTKDGKSMQVAHGAIHLQDRKQC